ncbi:MAG: flagellar FlbD family protein [Bdellovibrionota bacterium]
MIKLTRLNSKEFVLNSDLIKFIESTPDTIISLTTGEKIMVRESVEEVVQATIRYRRSLSLPGSTPDNAPGVM